MMNDSIIYLLIGFLALILGFVIGRLYTKMNFGKEITEYQKEQSRLDERLNSLRNSLEEGEKEKNDLNEELKFIQKEKESLIAKNTSLEEQLKNLQEKLSENKSEIEKLQEKFTKEFENLANKILDEKSTKFTNQNRENIKNILEPLEKKIQDFEKKVTDSDEKRAGFQSALKTQLENLKQLNQQMSKEAVNLTKALKGDSKSQGNWGELVLERVLEKSGLEKDREYFVQQSFVQNEGRRVLPDVVIHLPDNKKMIIDSKVSLTAYEQFINEDDEILKSNHLKDHLASLKRHIEQLSEKKYEDLYEIESPDFVLLFVPIETAFSVATNEDPSIYNKAFERNIVIVTPSTLLATLRTIDTMWTNEKQQRNAIEIARQAGALYDKFNGLLQDLIGVGKRIDESKNEYSKAMNKLVEGRGNLISSVEKLKKMGAKAKKSLPDNILDRAGDSED